MLRFTLGWMVNAKLRILVVWVAASAGMAASTAAVNFAPLERWRAAVVSGDASALKSFYSAQPAAVALTADGVVENDEQEAHFLASLHKSGLSEFTIDPIRIERLRDGVEEAIFQAAAKVQSPRGAQTFYLSFSQLWIRDNELWHIASENRSTVSRLRKPNSLDRVIYRADADAHAEVRQALQTAARENKRVILDFGANWCYDCHVLDLALAHSDLTPLVEANYELVHIDVGEMDRNLDLARQYQVPLEKGIPALAVLDSNGRLLFSQQQGEFEAARRLGPEDIVAFLNQWKPAGEKGSNKGH